MYESLLLDASTPGPAEVAAAAAASTGLWLNLRLRYRLLKGCRRHLSWIYLMDVVAELLHASLRFNLLRTGDPSFSPHIWQWDVNLVFLNHLTLSRKVAWKEGCRKAWTLVHCLIWMADISSQVSQLLAECHQSGTKHWVRTLILSEQLLNMPLSLWLVGFLVWDVWILGFADCHQNASSSLGPGHCLCSADTPVAAWLHLWWCTWLGPLLLWIFYQSKVQKQLQEGESAFYALYRLIALDRGVY